MRRLAVWLMVALAAVQLGCSGGGSAPPPPPPQPTVTVAPPAASVRAGDTQQFNATVTGTTSPVAWSVSGVAGGNATVGTVNSNGLYTAPAALPNPANVSVTASAGVASGSSAVSLLNPIPVIAAVNPTVAGVGTFTIIVTGDKFVQGAQITLGGMALTTTFVSSTMLAARATVTQSQAGNMAVAVTNPNPGSATSAATMNLQVVSGDAVSFRAAARFLEQSTFGPTAESLDQLRQVGFEAFLNDQFNAPSSGFDDPVADAQGRFNSPDTLQKRWWTNALYGQDQLRQRMAFALHKIWVVSWVVVEDSRGFVRYLRMHQSHAFGNYRDIMENVTKDPAMGRYQDIANNDGAPTRTVNCNENYGRELMQLFTLGLYKLNPDGTLQRDAQNQPIPAYDPVFTVEQNACAMTGWTYVLTPGRPPWPRPVNFSGPLEAVDSHHDMTAKTLIDDFPVPAGLTAEAELDLVLDNIFVNANIAPFVSKLLIQQFVTSNPSPAYVARVTQAFTTGRFSNAAATFGSGNRGDMKAVIAAMLLDPEARRGDTLPPDDPQLANDGKLKEPILLISNVFRAVGAGTDGSNLSQPRGTLMDQRLLYPPTVFSYFSPEYSIPGTNLLGPELNIQTTATTFERINFLNTIFFNSLGGTTISIDAFAAFATNPDAPGQLYDVLSFLLLRSGMSAEFRASLRTAVNAVTVSNPPTPDQLRARARTALYLVTASSQYQVQH